MGTQAKSDFCRIVCWIVSALAGFAAFVWLIRQLEWGVLGALLAGLLVFAVLGYLLSSLFCRSSRVESTLGTAATGAAGMAAGGVAAAGVAARSVGDAAERAADVAGGAMASAGDAVADTARAGWDAAGDAASGVTDAAGSAMDAAGDAVSGAADEAADQVADEVADVAAREREIAEEAARRREADAAAREEAAAKAKARAEAARAKEAEEAAARAAAEAEAKAEAEAQRAREAAAEEARRAEAAAQSAAEPGFAEAAVGGIAAAGTADIGRQPQGLSAARGGKADDLTRISGVGPKLNTMLNGMGYYHFDQIAAWDAEEIAWVDSNLEGFKGRVTRDDWVPQARRLAGEADGGVDYDGDGVVEGSAEGSKPTLLTEARAGGADDLKRIKGVGPKMERMLNSMGIFHFDQVASWSGDEVAWVDANLEGFKGRVSRDNWVEQAKLLATGGETEFSKRVDKGDVYD